ncbi:MAG TPA: hypothetical protein VHS30_12115, partial [Streptosporangiaceae bacterium]|nr:hypothetical protein [Streptosporangiaceae bacterium]
TETGGITSVTESAGRIWAGLARRYGSSLVLLEHHPAPESGEGMETLDLVPRMADPAGEPASRRAGTVYGRLWAPDRRQARELARLV